MLKKTILLTAHGSTTPDAKKSYINIDRIVKKEFKDIPVRWAYTSSFVRHKLAGKGIETDSISESLDKMKQDGVKEVVIQSLHIVRGSVYEEIIKAVTPFENAFEKISIGAPLLNSAGDLEKFSKALGTMIPSERTGNDAVVLAAHGSRRNGYEMLAAAGYELNRKDNKIFVGAVSGQPAFGEVRRILKESEVKKAYLIPMMTAAGGHVRNDMAGSKEDSWKTMLESDGTECVPVMKGLGEDDNMAAIFVDHLKKAVEL